MALTDIQKKWYADRAQNVSNRLKEEVDRCANFANERGVPAYPAREEMIRGALELYDLWVDYHAAVRNSQ